MSDWILCLDRLPVECECVLLYMERDAWHKNGNHFRKRDIEKGWHVEGKWFCDGCSRVIGLAWMPLPKPPRIKKHNG